MRAETPMEECPSTATAAKYAWRRGGRSRRVGEREGRTRARRSTWMPMESGEATGVSQSQVSNGIHSF